MDSPVEFSISSVRARIAASGVDILCKKKTLHGILKPRPCYDILPHSPDSADTPCIYRTTSLASQY